MDERVGGAVDAGRPLTVAGRMLEPGGQTPDFALDHFDGPSMASVSLADVAGSTVVLNVVNSVDTPVCDVQTRRCTTPFPAPRSWSMDLPFALARWAAAGVSHPAVSSHRSEDFGRAKGVLIKEWRARQRSIFVIEGAGRLTYAEYVTDQGKEPDHDADAAAAAAASG